MEEDRLYELFADFDPEMSSDASFKSRLEENFETVELVKRQISDAHRRSRRAIVVAGVTGFVFGIAVAALYPLIAGYISALAMAAGVADSYGTPLLLTAICACGFAMTYAAYDIALAAIGSSLKGTKGSAFGPFIR